jgi:hypothetical protein
LLWCCFVGAACGDSVGKIQRDTRGKEGHCFASSLLFDPLLSLISSTFDLRSSCHSCSLIYVR